MRTDKTSIYTARLKLWSTMALIAIGATLVCKSALADLDGNSQGAPLPGDPAKKVQDAPAKEPLNNRSFVELAAGGGMAEVEYSKLALKKTQNKTLQKFAEKMIDDHESANVKLKQIAQRLSISLPTELAPPHQDILKKLQTLSGATFDQEFVNVMVKDHDTTVGLFDNAAATPNLNSELQAFAKQTLPTLRIHQREAHDLNATEGQQKNVPTMSSH